MILYDFKCPNGHVFEGFANIHDKTHVCERCGEVADKLISMPTIKLEGWSGHFPTAADRWTRIHEKAGKAK